MLLEFIRNCSLNYFELFVENKRENCEWSETNVSRPEATKQAELVVGERHANRARHARDLARLGVHYQRFDHVGWHRDERGNETGGHGCREMRDEIVLEVFRLDEVVFEFVVEGELTHGHEDAAQRGHVKTGVEAEKALDARDSIQRFEAVLVVATLVQRQACVVLHANVDQICWTTFLISNEYKL